MARGPRKRSKAVTPVTAASAAATPATAAPVTAAPASASAAIGATASVREGRARAVIDAVSPVVDGGRFAAKRIAGEPVAVEAHCFTDGHDKLRVVLTWRPVTATVTASASEGREVEMKAAPNDVWTAEFIPQLPGRYRYTVSAWVDHFESWRHEL
ncbi:MAG TPA: maltotransferase domain-containing protein, partial [Steroidobacteraceae bacterium]